MGELFFELPIEKIGWVCLQFLWISTLYLGAITLVLKILRKFRSKLKYSIGLGALLMLPLIPMLLFVTHKGILPPIGLADWGVADAGQAARQPIIEGLPQISGIEMGSLIPSLYSWLGILWIIGVFIFIGYYLISTRNLYTKCRKKPSLNDAKISGYLEDLANDLDISNSFKIVESSFREGPAVAGVFPPYILIPSLLPDKYNDEELRALLLHELVHIKRKDYFFALIQRFICGIFIFQPMVWWLNTQINREREHVCDEIVTSITQDSYLYGNTLVKLHLESQTSVAQTLNISGHSTVGRIELLLESEGSTMGFVQKCSRSFIAFLIMGITLFGTLWSSYHLHPVDEGQIKSAEVGQLWNINGISYETTNSKLMIKEYQIA